MSNSLTEFHFLFQGQIDSLSNETKETLLEEAENIYKDAVDSMIDDPNMKNLFSWYNEPVTVHMILGKSNSNWGRDIFYFAQLSNKNELILHNFLSETNSFDYKQSPDPRFKLSWLIDKKLIAIDMNTIIPESLTIEHYIDAWAKRWVAEEFKIKEEHFSKNPVELVDFNEIYLRPDMNRFNTMIQTINSTQFTLELNECLFAYKNEKWFICASGLGALLEEIMWLTLVKHHEDYLIKDPEPTAAIYRSAFRRSKKINMDQKTDIYLKHIFGLRNSVNHYKTGFANKKMVDDMLEAIELVFQDYYLLPLS